MWMLNLVASNALSQLQVAQAVNTAARQGMTVGAGVGAATGVLATTSITKPNWITAAIQGPFRLMNAPAYYGLGGKAADDRLKVLELAASTANEAQNNWWRGLQEKALRIDGIEIKLAEDYISALKESFTGAALAVGPPASPPASASAVAEAVQPTVRMLNPHPPSFCTLGSFIDPFNERYTCIVLNDQGRYLLCAVLVIAVTASGVMLLMYVIRLAIRLSLRAKRAFLRMASEERLADQKQALQRDFTQPSMNRDFEQPSPMTELR